MGRRFPTELPITTQILCCTNAHSTDLHRERKIVLAGEALLRRVDRGEWDVADFRAMMGEFPFRPADRVLFDLDDE